MKPELDRCEREQADLIRQAEETPTPAWLVTLGLEDWEMEKRLIRAQRPVRAAGAGTT